jgi:thiol-disulfide isomerase/thioredoxin
VLGLILTGAALRGPNLETSLLLLTYGLGAATSLAAGMLAGGRLFATVRRSTRWGDAPRRMLGAAVVTGAAAIWLGLDAGTLTRWSSATASSFERNLIAAMSQEPSSIVRTAHAAGAPELSTPLASLLGAEQWLNALPPRPEDLRGKIVLVNFWTYSCINCLRALLHVRNWAQRYRDRGLVVIGVHTPEFAFEKDAANVAKALASLGVAYPVAIDNDFRIWRAFDNQAWPALYIIGADGRIRQRALGEGRYDELQRLIQRLLPEGDDTPTTSDTAAIVGDGPQAQADERNLRSGESYVGYSQATGFVSPGGIRQDAPSLYRSASKPPLNHWSLAGIWRIGREFATLSGASGSISYRFHARDLHLVLAPASPGQSIRFRVKLDGASPGSDHGSDVDADGWGTVQDGRLYQLIRQSGPVADRTFEIEFLGTGVRAYSFTFG